MKLTANFWRCNLTKRIRIGYWLDNGVFREVAFVAVNGAEYTDEEAALALSLCR